LFRVELEPNGRADVVIEEATPVFRSTDIRTTAVKAWTSVIVPIRKSRTPPRARHASGAANPDRS
jgi:hypothetical protein